MTSDELNISYDTVELPSMRVGGIRGTLADPAEAWKRLSETASGVIAEPGVSTLALFSPGAISGSAPDRTPYDAALVLPEGIAAPPGLTETEIPSGRYARCTFIGALPDLPRSWQAFSDWFRANGHEVGEGFCIEWYRTRHGEVPDDELHTDQYIPLA